MVTLEPYLRFLSSSRPIIITKVHRGVARESCWARPLYCALNLRRHEMKIFFFFFPIKDSSWWLRPHGAHSTQTMIGKRMKNRKEEKERAEKTRLRPARKRKGCVLHACHWKTKKKREREEELHQSTETIWRSDGSESRTWWPSSCRLVRPSVPFHIPKKCNSHTAKQLPVCLSVASLYIYIIYIYIFYSHLSPRKDERATSFLLLSLVCSMTIPFLSSSSSFSLLLI